jgi:hypothetical protein
MNTEGLKVIARVCRAPCTQNSLDTRLNHLLGTDTQPKDAAARHGLRAGQRQR